MSDNCWIWGRIGPSRCIETEVETMNNTSIFLTFGSLCCLTRVWGTMLMGILCHPLRVQTHMVRALCGRNLRLPRPWFLDPAKGMDGIPHVGCVHGVVWMHGWGMDRDKEGVCFSTSCSSLRSIG